VLTNSPPFFISLSSGSRLFAKDVKGIIEKANAAAKANLFLLSKSNIF